MASPVQLPDAFAGMMQDVPRDRLPKNKAWNIVDYIPAILGAPIAERGGWAYASSALTDYDASATYAKGVFFAPFAGGSQLLAIDDHSHLLEITSISTGVDKGVAVAPKQIPLFFNKLVILPSPDGTTAPYKYDGSAAPGALSATVANGQYGAVYGDRVWLGNVSGNTQRIFASAPSDPTTWDLTDTWLDVSAPITAVAALPTVLLVFMEDHTARFRGTQPPPQEDISIDDPLFQYGCIDARSVAVSGSYCVFANQEGVFLTNGTAFPTDITLACGIKQYWLSLLAGYSASTWTISSGWYGNYIVLTIMNGTTFVDGFIFDVRTSSVVRISNLDAAMMAPAIGVQQELYVASRKHPRLYSLSSMFNTPGSTFAKDGDGTAVLPVWETPFYDEGKSFGSQRWRNAYLEYDLRDPGGQLPTMTLEVCFSPEAGAPYTVLAPTLAATTQKTGMRVPIRQKSRGAGFKVTRQNASSDARIYSLAAEVYQREGSRLY